ncbi:MAG TPA: DNA mismatch repair protein MutS [Chitinophagaceae bacterium]|nr:DNA mismatch repair protein MutS [Chitinophagaceae bacterium]
MKVYPASATVQLEFDKVALLLQEHCKTEYGINKAKELRIHTAKQFIEIALQQTHEFKLLLLQGMPFPNDFSTNIARDIKLLGIPGSVLKGDQWLLIRKLLENMERIFRWFDTERREAFPALTQVIDNSYYEKYIIETIDDIIDEHGNVKDTASSELQKIRINLYRKRNELRRAFEKVVARLNKAGYAADIEESFSNGRRVVAVFSEYKRQVKGILHGESDSRRTSFIEPEETIDLNNDVFSLENEEQKEVIRILRALTTSLSGYAPLIQQYLQIVGEYDFIRGKAQLAMQMNANLPNLVDKAVVELTDAYHPLLLLYNQKANKPTIPTNVALNADSRILVISGPNAGGKTVTMKTIGLNQLMLQSGLLVPVSAVSTMGIFKQLFIHIGDTQSIEFELSTYSSHLLHMKHFIENANGKTMFFIDELGSGSDPNLGGAFAEVIMEELARRHSMGIVTTHYLNLKVMANHTKGIINGAMAFDEKTLQPLYKLTVGKPGSSYTFSIAERIGLPQHLINRARKLVDEDHFRLDKLLNRTEQDLQTLDKERVALNKLLKENERLRKDLQITLDKEKHQQQVELLREQNKLNSEKLTYLKDTERKLRQLVLEWRKTDDKQKAVQEIQQVLFPQKEKVVVSKMERKLKEKYFETKQPITVGAKVKLKKNHQVGDVKEIRGKKVIVQVGLLPITVDLIDLVTVQEKNTPQNS